MICKHVAQENETTGLRTGLSIVTGEVKISTLRVLLFNAYRYRPINMYLGRGVSGKALYAWLESDPWQTRSDRTALVVRVTT